LLSMKLAAVTIALLFREMTRLVHTSSVDIGLVEKSLAGAPVRNLAASACVPLLMVS
jgi:hypothetical protein